MHLNTKYISTFMLDIGDLQFGVKYCSKLHIFPSQISSPRPPYWDMAILPVLQTLGVTAYTPNFTPSILFQSSLNRTRG